MSAFEFKIGELTLYAGDIPGRKSPYLGLRSGAQVVMLARFLSAADYEFFRAALENLNGFYFPIDPREPA